jgi:hypothetical protein
MVLVPSVIARKRAIIAIAHTLLKIVRAVFKTGKPYEEPGADFCIRRESAQAREEYLLRQLHKLRPATCPARQKPADSTNRRRLLTRARLRSVFRASPTGSAVAEVGRLASLSHFRVILFWVTGRN